MSVNVRNSEHIDKLSVVKKMTAAMLCLFGGTENLFAISFDLTLNHGCLHENVFKSMDEICSSEKT